MLLTKEKKSQFIADLASKLENNRMIVMVDYQGMKNETISNFRNSLAENGMGMKVTKNTLLRIALKEKNIEIPAEILDKQLAIIVADDEVLPAKATFEFAKKNEFPVILGAIADNKFIDASQVKQLAMLPSREELLAKVVGSIAAPTYSFVNVLAGNIRGLINVLNQQASKTA